MQNKKYDLKERILIFVLAVIHIIKKLPNNKINFIFSNQIIRSASSIGANYEEADGTPTKRDFLYKMGLVKKEAKETKYWLTLFKQTNDKKYFTDFDHLLTENEEIIKIVSSILIKSS